MHVSGGDFEHSKTIIFFLCSGAFLAAAWGMWCYYTNSGLFAQLQAQSLRGRHLRDELGFTPYDTVWVVAGATLSAGVAVLAWEMVM
jgi:hypothetical protein